MFGELVIKFLRIFFWLCLSGLLLVVALVLSSTWWLPSALPWLLGRVDVEIRSVSRTEGQRFSFSEVRYKDDAVVVSIEELATPAPLPYLWERLRGEFTDASRITATTVEVRLRAADTETETERTDDAHVIDPVGLFQEIRAAMRSFEPWIPVVRVETANLYQEAERVLTATKLSLERDWTVGGQLQMQERPDVVSLEGDVSPDAPWRLVVLVPERTARMEARLAERHDGLHLEFSVVRDEEVMMGEAHFVAGHWIPDTARMQSEGFRVDPESWGVTDAQGIEGLGIEGLVVESLDLSWQDGRYRGVVALFGQYRNPHQDPEADDLAELIPMHVNLSLSGDMGRMRIDSGRLNVGWASLWLEVPTEIDLRAGSVSEDTELRLEVDLSAQPFMAGAEGRIAGRLVVHSGGAVIGGAPLGVSFQLDGESLRYDGYGATEVAVSGTLHGDRLQIAEAHIQPEATVESGQVRLSGEADLALGSLDFNYAIEVAGDWLNALIGAPYFVGDVVTRGRILGTFEAPEIEGTIESLTVAHPATMPIALTGDFRVEGTERFAFEGSLLCEGSEVGMRFDGGLTETALTVIMQALEWTDPERPPLRLEAPATLTYQLAGYTGPLEGRIEMSPFQLTGPDLGIQGHYTAQDGLALELRNVSLARVDRWVTAELPPYIVEAIDVTVTELRPYLVGAVGIHARTPEDAEIPIQLALTSRFRQDGFALERIEFDFAGEPILAGQLEAPVRLRIPDEGEAFYQVLERGELKGRMSGASTEGFVRWLEAMSGVILGEARLQLEVDGSLEAPAGRLVLQISSLETTETVEAAWPDIRRISVEARADVDAIALDSFSFFLNQSEVTGSGRIPIRALVGFLNGEFDAEALDLLLAAGEGEIRLVNWNVEDWVDLLPAHMRQTGRLSGWLRLARGTELTGDLEFEDFGLRPTATLPLIDSIQGRVTLNDRMVTVEHASARMGGSLLELVGWVDASDFQKLYWDISATGKNVPLVRTTDMILRSDLDVQATHTAEVSPVVGGRLNLRSSTLLVEFDPLAPNVEGGPMQSPPFFSIDEPFVADWRFDLEIFGDSFMRVRSPYFRATVSASAELGGTFADPLLTGSVRTADAELNFPGAKMTIESGEAFIAPGRPDAVQLAATGTAQTASYIITMEVSQTLQDPQVQFQSTPALSNAAIVRLLATGSTTGGGAGTVGLYLGRGLLGTGGAEDGIGDRLTIDVGQERSRTGRNTVGVRFDLTDNWYLQGGYDVYDAYNMNLIWSVFSR